MMWTLQLYSTPLSRGHASVPITTCKCQRSGEHAQRWLLAVENYRSQKKKRILEDLKPIDHKDPKKHLKPIDHKDPKKGSSLLGKITKEKSLRYRCHRHGWESQILHNQIQCDTICCPILKYPCTIALDPRALKLGLSLRLSFEDT
eukprot:TRINITY_DN48703_c0_g1_i1.p1 TRINITY_DN48703_c0_g1~~TRINITY_DN48703_c0_g1_i1.p1  ORF type:complete len:146 (+),score=12.86 TRINITY_DN48703_c0_g1_i1:361-798(+)